MTSSSDEMVLHDRLVVFFDGHCGLCNRYVDFIIKHDHLGKILFSPLQGEFAKKSVSEALRSDLSSVVVMHRGHIYLQDQAVIRVGLEMGGHWRLLAQMTRIIPSFMRSWAYQWVAKNRYRWFGRSDTCRIPQPQERSRFI